MSATVSAPNYVTIPSSDQSSPWEPPMSWKISTKADIDKNSEMMRLQALESMQQKLKQKTYSTEASRAELEADLRNFVKNIRATAQSQFNALLKQEKETLQWASTEGGISDSFIREQQTIMDTMQHKKETSEETAAAAHSGQVKDASKSPTTNRTKPPAPATPATPAAAPSRSVLSPTNERGKLPTTNGRTVTSPKPTVTPKTPANRTQGPQNFTSPPPLSAKPSRDTNTTTASTNHAVVRSPSATWQKNAQPAVTPTRAVGAQAAAAAKKDMAKTPVKSPAPGPSSGPAARDRRASIAPGPVHSTPSKTTTTNTVSRPGADKNKTNGNGNNNLTLATTSAAAAKPAPEFWQPTVSRDQASPTTRKVQVLPNGKNSPKPAVAGHSGTGSPNPRQSNGVAAAPTKQTASTAAAAKGGAKAEDSPRLDKGKAVTKEDPSSKNAAASASVPSVIRQDKTKPDEQQRVKQQEDASNPKDVEQRRKKEAELRKLQEEEEKRHRAAETPKQNGKGTKEHPLKSTQQQNGVQDNRNMHSVPGPSSLHDTTTTSYDYDSSTEDEDERDEDASHDYLGPRLEVDDATDDTTDDVQFEWYKAHVQEQKIFEFHWEAARADVDLARELQRLRKKSSGFTREDEAVRIEEHKEKMVRLKETKEAERRQLIHEERVKRRAQAPQAFSVGASSSSSFGTGQISLKGASPASQTQTLQVSSSPQASTSSSLRDMKSPPPALVARTLASLPTSPPKANGAPSSPPKVDPTQVGLPNSPAKPAIPDVTPPRPVTLEEVEDEDAAKMQARKNTLGAAVPGSPPKSKQTGQEASSSLHQLHAQTDAPLIFSVATPDRGGEASKGAAPSINGHVPSKSVTAQSNGKQNWDPTDMTSPAYWEALLSDGDQEKQTKHPPIPSPKASMQTHNPQSAPGGDPQKKPGEAQGRKVLSHMDNEQEMQAELERLEAEKRSQAASERARKKQMEEQQQRTKEERFRKQQREYNERLASEEREKGTQKNQR